MAPGLPKLLPFVILNSATELHPSFQHIDHRPWPLPDRPWRMRNSWCDLLFAHWRVPAETLQPLVPSSLKIQEFDGTSWVGVVPFRMEGVMPRGFPDIPGLSAFPELNLRLYVEPRQGGKPGVWFLSLDATNPIAVWTAQTFFKLPYYWARMNVEKSGEEIRYQSERRRDGVGFEGSYRPTGEPFQSQPGSLEHWLTERYCLYSASPDGRLFRGEIHHEPWTLQNAEAEFQRNELAQAHGFELEGPPATLHFARRLDVALWTLEEVSA